MGRITGILIAIALGLVFPSAAQATFPGENGKIAYVNGGDIWTMNPDGSGQVNLTNDASGQGSPSWSPDGAMIAYVDGTATWKMNADGTGRTFVTTGPGPTSARDPAWSPDGTKLIFTTGGFLFAVNPDGTGMTFIRDGAHADPEWSPAGDLISFISTVGLGGGDEMLYTVRPDGTAMQAVHPSEGVWDIGSSWSPDGERLASWWDCGSHPTCEHLDLGLHTIKPDSTDKQKVPVGGFYPTYSPDGHRFAFMAGPGPGSVYTVDIDGSGLSAPLATGSEPDWQPILRGYARAKAATPMYTPLVPAHAPCASPNRVHAAPLSYNSCNPPSPASGFATVGSPDANGAPAKSVGSLKLVAIGEVPIDTGNGNQSDVVIDASITDVRYKTGLTDYTGGLRVKAALQITDRNNTPYPGGPGPGTVVPATFEFNLPCATTPSDATIGSTCSTSTTANVVLPGQVLERQRAIWELGRVEVHDGGTDGNPSTAGDNTLFATQGIFVP